MINKKGFSLLELIIVICLIGILGIFIIPKIINVSSDAQDSVTQTLASKLNSGARMNYYIRTINSSKGIPIINCKDASLTLQNGLPVGYKITSKKIANDVIVKCVLKGPNNSKANFNARGVN